MINLGYIAYYARRNFYFYTHTVNGYSLNCLFFGKWNFAFVSRTRRSTSEKILFISSSVYSYALRLAQLPKTFSFWSNALVRCVARRLKRSRLLSLSIRRYYIPCIPIVNGYERWSPFTLYYFFLSNEEIPPLVPSISTNTKTPLLKAFLFEASVLSGACVLLAEHEDLVRPLHHCEQVRHCRNRADGAFLFAANLEAGAARVYRAF